MTGKDTNGKIFKGVYTVVPTPLLDDQSVDFKSLENLIGFYIEEGAHGLLILGSYGEMPYFSFEERVDIIKRSVQLSNGQIPVVCGAGFHGLPEAKLFLERTKDIPVDGYLVVLPTYFKIKHKDCLDYFKEIANYTDKPLMYYHIPQITGLSTSSAELSELLLLDGISGVKDSSLYLPYLKKTATLTKENNMFYFSGSSFLLSETLKHGGDGVMCTVASISPRTVSGCYNAYISGNIKQAKLLQNKIFSFLPIISSFSIPASIQKSGFKLLSRFTMSSIPAHQAINKEYLKQIGLIKTSKVRSPLPQITGTDISNVTDFIKNSNTN